MVDCSAGALLLIVYIKHMCSVYSRAETKKNANFLNPNPTQIFDTNLDESQSSQSQHCISSFKFFGVRFVLT